MDSVHTEERNGLKISIWHDEDCMHPRRDCDPLGHMVCFHKRYDIGEKHDYRQDDYRSWDELEAAICKNEDVAIILPVYMYDHSGTCINTTGYSCPWDSGQVGFIYVTKKEAKEGWLVKRLTKKTLARIKESLVTAIEEYSLYMQGLVYGYTIEDKDGNAVESCGGYIGYYDDEKYGALSDARIEADRQTEGKKSA